MEHRRGVQAGRVTVLVLVAALSMPAFAGPGGPALTSGAAHACQAKNASGSRTWPCTIRVTSLDPSSGALMGEVTWTSLNSVHRIRGTLAGDRLAFTEAEAIHPGGAHLQVAYSLTVSERSASGTWVDPADQSRGSMSIDLAPAAAAAPRSPSGPPLTGGATFPCVAKDAGGGKSWPCTFHVSSFDGSTGALVGEVAWTSLGSVHRIRGALSGEHLSFTEAEAIRAGPAHLHVAYSLTVSERSASGSWVDPVDQSRGSMTIDLVAR